MNKHDRTPMQPLILSVQEWIKPKIPLLVSILFLILPFHLLLFDSFFFCYRDLLRFFLPIKKFWLNGLLTEGSIPVWNSMIGGGLPHWADLRNGVLYPLNLILLFFGQSNFILGFNWYIFAHIGLSFTSMYFFLLKRGFEPVDRSIFSLMYALGGIQISTLSILNYSCGLYLMPIFAHYLVLWSQRNHIPSRWEYCILPICLALPIYAGGPEFTYFFGLFLFIALIIGFNFHKFRAFSIIGIFSLLLAAGQLVPGIDHLNQTARGAEGIKIHEASWFSVHPARIWELFLVSPFGSYGREGGYWGRSYTSGPLLDPLLFSHYMSIYAMFCLIGFFHNGLQKKGLIIIALLLGICLAAGAFIPINLFSLFFQYFPFWNLFRYPAKIMWFVMFGLLVMSAKGQSGLYHWLKAKPKTGYPALILPFILLAVVYRILFAERFNAEALTWFIAIGGILLSLIIAMQYSSFFRKYGKLFILIVVGIDLWYSTYSIIWIQPTNLMKSKVANLLMREKQQHKEYFMRYSAALYQAKRNNHYVKVPDNLDPAAQASFRELVALTPNTNLLFGIPSIDSYANQASPNHYKFWRALAKTNPDRLLNLTSVGYFTLLNLDGTLSLHVNKTALPFTQVFGSIISTTSFSESLITVMSEQFDESKTIVVTSQTEVDTKKSKKKDKLLLTEPLAQIQSVHRRPSSITLNLSRGSGWLLVNESYNPYWKAFYKNEELPVALGNGWAMAINLRKACSLLDSQSNCEIKLKYKNPHLIPSLWISLITLLVLCCLPFTIQKWQQYKKIDSI